MTSFVTFHDEPPRPERVGELGLVHESTVEVQFEAFSRWVGIYPNSARTVPP